MSTTVSTILDRNKTVSFLAVLFTVLLALGLRTWNLAINPPELYGDEAVSFAGVRSVIETGKDLDGRSIFYLSDRVELRPPLYGLLAYLSTRFCGENPFGIRLPAALLGTFTVLLVYLLVLELTARKPAALLAALCLAILPWHIHLTRVGWEPATLLPLLLSAILVFTKGVATGKPLVLLGGCSLFGFTIYTYTGAPLPAFLFFVFMLASQFRFFLKHRLQLVLGCSVAGLLAVPYIIIALTQPELLDRAKRISTFAVGFNPGTLLLFCKNYIAHFNPVYFLSGVDGRPVISPQTAILYWWMLPFIVCGIIGAWRMVKTRPLFWLLVYWLLVYPLGGSLSNDGVPHINRTLIGAPLFAILTGIGILFAIDLAAARLFKNVAFKFIPEIIIAGLAVLALISVLRFTDFYFKVYPIKCGYAWNYGQAEVFRTVKAIDQKYDRVFFGNLDYWIEVPMLAYYYSGSRLTYLDEDEPYNWYQVPGTILVLRRDMRLPEKYLFIKTINDLTGNLLYTVVTIEPETKS